MECKTVKMQNKIKYISRALFESPYCIGLCLSEKAFYRDLNRLKIPKSRCPEWIPSNCNGRVWEFAKTDPPAKICIVCIRASKEASKVQVYGLIIHEAIHVWQAIKADVNEHEPSAEFEAYSIQAIAMRLIAAYKRQ